MKGVVPEPDPPGVADEEPDEASGQLRRHDPGGRVDAEEYRVLFQTGFLHEVSLSLRLLRATWIVARPRDRRCLPGVTCRQRPLRSDYLSRYRFIVAGRGKSAWRGSASTLEDLWGG